jgi:hypothetical protein
MKYNLSIAADAQKAREYLDNLATKQAMVEIKKVSPKRTISQNSYLHLIISAFGAHFGYSASESKLIYKELNKDIYAYNKKGRTFYRSSADLTKEEMAKSIDTFREASDNAGYPLPLATDAGWLAEIENAIEQSRYYL